MIQVLNYTKDPISHLGEVAGICWGSDTSINVKNYKRGLECIENNHGRVLEYADIELVIGGYSARMIRELYTSIIGTSRLQESTRYVNCDDFGYYIPPTINDAEKLKAYKVSMKSIKESYEELIDLGIPKEDVANILPLGMNTKVVLKINLRALVRLFEVRTCTRAYKEYRAFMQDLKKVLSQLDDEWNYLCKEQFKTICEKTGYCVEKYCCGRKPKKENIIIVDKEEYSRLKQQINDLEQYKINKEIRRD